MLHEWLLGRRMKQRPCKHSRRMLPWQLCRPRLRNRMQQTLCQTCRKVGKADLELQQTPWQTCRKVDKAGLLLHQGQPDQGRAVLLPGQRIALRVLVPQHSHSDKKARRGKGERVGQAEGAVVEIQ